MWTVARQAPLSMEFSRQEYWTRWPFHFPGDLPNPGIEPGFPALLADSLLSEPPGKPQNVKAKNSKFSFCVVVLHSLQNLSSPVKGWTWDPALKAPSPNHWTTREFPTNIYYLTVSVGQEPKYSLGCASGSRSFTRLQWRCWPWWDLHLKAVASPCTSMLQRCCLSSDFKNLPLLASGFYFVASSPLSAFTGLRRVRTLLWIKLWLKGMLWLFWLFLSRPLELSSHQR